MTQLKMLTTDDKIEEIRRLYFQTTKATIQADLTKALDLLKSMPTEEERERASVFMDGLAEMRKDWGLAKGGEAKSQAKSPKSAQSKARPRARKKPSTPKRENS